MSLNISYFTKHIKIRSKFTHYSPLFRIFALTITKLYDLLSFKLL